MCFCTSSASTSIVKLGIKLHSFDLLRCCVMQNLLLPLYFEVTGMSGNVLSPIPSIPSNNKGQVISKGFF